MDIRRNRRIDGILLAVGCIAIIGCAHAVPQELVSARETFRIVNGGWTAYAAPYEMHIAKAALEQAERAFLIDPESYQVRDLAYVAERKSLFAEATALTAAAKSLNENSNDVYRMAQVRKLPNIVRDYRVSQNVQEIVENRTRIFAEQKGDDLEGEGRGDPVSKFPKSAAPIVSEPRETIVVLSVDLLFASGVSTLTSDAMPLLDRIGDILLGSGIHSLRVEAHCDSSGLNDENAVLSKNRAETVRDYLVQRGYDERQIVSSLRGDGVPIEDDGSAHGRDAGCHIELIVVRDADTEISVAQ